MVSPKQKDGIFYSARFDLADLEVDRIDLQV